MPLRYLIIIPLWIAVWAGLHYYLWRRLARDTGLPRFWRQVVFGLLAALAASVPVAVFSYDVAPGAAARVLAWPAFLWMGAFFYVVIALGIIDLARLVARRVRPRSAEPVDRSRREFSARLVAGAAAAAAGGLVTVGIISARGAPEVTEVPVELPRLPTALDGFRIVQLSDLHAGNTLGRGHVERLVEATNRAQPDLIAFTGDIADARPADIRDIVAPLRDLRAPHGVYYVTGNHDYYVGVDPWLEELGSLGIRVLRNERVSIGVGDDSFDLIGIDDHEAQGFGNGHGADLTRALHGSTPGRERVLLAHQPRQVSGAVKHDVGLVLSGHTHGGQIWPMHYAVQLQQGGYLSGRYLQDLTQMYVHRGSGYWGPPIRTCAPPEIARVTLRHAKTVLRTSPP